MNATLTDRRRRSNRTKGAALAFSGVLLAAVAAAGLVSQRPVAEALASAARGQAASGGQPVPAAQCSGFLQQAGAQVDKTSSSLKGKRPLPLGDFAEVESAVYRLSVAASQCGYPVIAFCAGPACEIPGISLELQLPAGSGAKP